MVEDATLMSGISKTQIRERIMVLQIERERIRVRLAECDAAIEELVRLLQLNTRRIELKEPDNA